MCVQSVRLFVVSHSTSKITDEGVKMGGDVGQGRDGPKILSPKIFSPKIFTAKKI